MKPVFYNTLSRKRESFSPQNPERVTMYVCGPTVYAAPHIGNARSAVVFDVLARLLRHLYPKLLYVRNITDIDDKIIIAAHEQNRSCEEITQNATRLYHNTMKALHVAPPDIEPRVTETLQSIISLILNLLSRGHAYEREGHVLFHVPSCPHYGSLSRRDPSSPKTLARIENLPFKRHMGDFILWKPAKDQEPGWQSPWGRGRPGWHIECSAMIHKHLGDTIDIHGGGQDLIFPHHENEIAQGRCTHDDPHEAVYSRFWLHNGMVTVEGEKMSKSAGNVILVNDVEQKPEVVRLALLSTHYRQTLDWTVERLREAHKILERLYGVWRDIEEETTPLPHCPPSQKVVQALCEDLNTPSALVSLHAQATAARHAKDKKEALGVLRASADLLGLLQKSPQQWFGLTKDKDVEKLVFEREQARQRKDFEEADEIRKNLEKRGILLEDGPHGTRWRRSGY